MSTTTTDPLTAWVEADRDEELERYRQWYATRYPAPSGHVTQEQTS